MAKYKNPTNGDIIFCAGVVSFHVKAGEVIEIPDRFKVSGNLIKVEDKAEKPKMEVEDSISDKPKKKPGRKKK